MEGSSLPLPGGGLWAYAGCAPDQAAARATPLHPATGGVACKAALNCAPLVQGTRHKPDPCLWPLQAHEKCRSPMGWGRPARQPGVPLECVSLERSGGKSLGSCAVEPQRPWGSLPGAHRAKRRLFTCLWPACAGASLPLLARKRLHAVDLSDPFAERSPAPRSPGAGEMLLWGVLHPGGLFSTTGPAAGFLFATDPRC